MSVVSFPILFGSDILKKKKMALIKRLHIE